MYQEKQYLDLLEDILTNGVEKPVYGTDMTIRSVFGRTLRFDLSQGFPLLTTKRMFWKGIVHELLWFLRGDQNIKYLVDNGVHIWDEWAYKAWDKYQKTDPYIDQMTQDDFIAGIKADEAFAADWGNLGQVYGTQWRNWHTSDGRTVDQIKWALWKLRNQPERKHIVVTAWNPEFIYEMAAPGQAAALPPCHMIFQFNVANNRLSCMLTQRSVDSFLGAPFNIASYALLTRIMAHCAGLEPGELIIAMGDAHLYSNHLDAAREQVKRLPYPFPKLDINVYKTEPDQIEFGDILLEGYQYHPALKGDITVVGGFNERDAGKF